jgi:hypothetical protein
MWSSGLPSARKFPAEMEGIELQQVCVLLAVHQEGNKWQAA